MLADEGDWFTGVPRIGLVAVMFSVHCAELGPFEGQDL